MHVKGAVFQPELIELMKAVLDDAARTLPRGEAHIGDESRTCVSILACAAKGERDPIVLKMMRCWPSWNARTIRMIFAGTPGGVSRTILWLIESDRTPGAATRLGSEGHRILAMAWSAEQSSAVCCHGP